VSSGHYSGDDFIGPQLVNHPVYPALFVFRFFYFFIFSLSSPVDNVKQFRMCLLCTVP
jgi:hypothetical protein